MRELRPRDLVVELVRTLDEALVTYDSRNARDGGPRLMPRLYSEGSYPELERQLGVMREKVRRPWWHLSMRYRWGTEVMTAVRARKTRQGPVPVLPPRSELLITGSSVTNNLMLVKLYTWSDRVVPTHVDEGVDWLLVNMYGGDTTRLTLPVEFLHRAMGADRVAV